MISSAIREKGKTINHLYYICQCLTSNYTTMVLTQHEADIINCKIDPDDLLADVAIDVLGNWYVTGYVKNAGSEDDVMTLKYDKNGNLPNVNVTVILLE